MQLNEIRDNPGANRPRKRKGRGIGSGLGKTSGKGHKGQKSRSGVAIKGFEGGQMPLHRRLPKRGFKPPNAKEFVAINLGRIQAAFDAGRLDAGQTVDAAAIKAAGLVKSVRDGVRLLGVGSLTAKAHFKVAGASKSARAAIEAAGGSLELPAPKAGADGEGKAAD